MSYSFPEGSKFFFSQTFAAAKTLSAMTNANPTVGTSVAHGFVDGDEALLTSGWEDATNAVFKLDQLTVDTVGITGLDTSNTSFFPAGGGANSTLQKISNWVEIPQILTISTQGGDPRFTTVSPLARRNSFNVPTGFNATSVTLTLGHDASNASYQQMLAITRTLTPVAIKMQLSGGAVTYGYGFLAASEFPSLNQNQPNQVQVSLALQGRAISYAS